MEIFRFAETLKSDVVNYLRDTEIMNLNPMELSAVVPMEKHLHGMPLEGTY